MMKKITVLILTVMLSTLLGACAKNESASNTQINESASNTQTTKEIYKDGTYTAESDKWKNGQEAAEVVIKDGKIENITLKRLDTNGQEVDYDQWTGAEVDGKKRPNLKQFRVDMAKTMVDKQTAEVDTITGATTTSKGWVQSVERALEKAKN